MNKITKTKSSWKLKTLSKKNAFKTFKVTKIGGIIR